MFARCCLFSSGVFIHSVFITEGAAVHPRARKRLSARHEDNKQMDERAHSYGQIVVNPLSCMCHEAVGGNPHMMQTPRRANPPSACSRRRDFTCFLYLEKCKCI